MATLELLAQRGQEGLTLREITDAAEANVASVGYHFGSLQALSDAAVAHALERYLDLQIQAMGGLTQDATLEALVAAFARPMVAALAAGGPDLAIMRTVARAGTQPPRDWERFDAKFVQSRTHAVRVLRANLPGIPESELIFRTRCAAGLLNWLALAPIGRELGSKSETHIERLLLPVLAGALHGHAEPDPRGPETIQIDA